MARTLRSSVVGAAVDAYDRHVGRYGPELAREMVRVTDVAAGQRALDVGCGTGENFRHLRGATSVAAVDISPGMVSLAADRARRLGLTADVRVGDAADLPYSDNSFDVVISAFSACTFPDHVAAFLEMERVTKPGGRILLVEHGRSSAGWIARRQDRVVAKNFESTACRSNRDPLGELSQALLDVSSHRVSHLGMMNRFVIEVSLSAGPGGGGRDRSPGG